MSLPVMMWRALWIFVAARTAWLRGTHIEG